MSNDVPHREYLFIKEAAQYLGISKATFYLHFYQYLVRLDTTRMIGSRPQYWIEDLNALRQNVNLVHLQVRGARMRRVRASRSIPNKKEKATLKAVNHAQPALFDWKQEDEDGSEI